MNQSTQKPICSVPLCNRISRTKSLCVSHYQRLKDGSNDFTTPIRSYRGSNSTTKAKDKFGIDGRFKEETVAEYRRRVYKELKKLIFDKLGNKCANCGYNENPLGFDIDHINNDGVLSRVTASGKTKKGSSNSDLKKILIQDCIGLQILCGTCHYIKTRTYNAEIGLYRT